MNPQLGLHVSIEGSLGLAVDRAQEVGATTFQMFTRNPNQWKFSPIPDDVAETFRNKRTKAGFRTVVVHMPYLPNLASSAPGIQKVSRNSLDEEVKRCDSLGADYLVVHLGSHMGAGTVAGVRNIADALNEALAESNGDAMILLENMAGQKNSIGARFEELRLILDRVRREDRSGVCLDSCHAYAAGFDLSGDEAVEQTMAIFDQCVGYENLKVVHLNDSKGSLGSNLDRHEKVGKGKIGVRGVRAILRHRGILERPLIVETPFTDVQETRRSLTTVRRLMG